MKFASRLAVAVSALAIGSVGAQAQWQGPYVGANLGFQLSAITNNATRPNGVTGGIAAGYNWQQQQFVFGGEADFQLSGADDVFAPWKFSNPWFGTLRGRAGFLLNNTTLFYATAGLALGELRAQSTTTGGSESRVHTGWTAGIGVEMAVTGNWSAKVEFLYVNLFDLGYALTGTNNGMDASILRLGVNYRF